MRRSTRTEKQQLNVAAERFQEYAGSWAQFRNLLGPIRNLLSCPTQQQPSPPVEAAKRILLDELAAGFDYVAHQPRLRQAPTSCFGLISSENLGARHLLDVREVLSSLCGHIARMPFDVSQKREHRMFLRLRHQPGIEQVDKQLLSLASIPSLVSLSADAAPP
jgi:hypothetical protein